MSFDTLCDCLNPVKCTFKKVMGMFEKKRAFIHIIILGLTIFPACNLPFFTNSIRASSMNPAITENTSLSAKNLKITVIYDNNPYKEGLTASWGFSCNIKGAEKTILFDTGGNSSVLLANMQQLGIDPKEIDIVVLSHVHGDHVGGLDGILKVNPDMTVYYPATFSLRFKDSLIRTGIKAVEVKDPTRICKGVYSTGVLGSWMKEQALMISTDRGMIVITGCAHPGIANILKVAKELIEDQILLVVGGFHLGAIRKQQLEALIVNFRKFGVQQVGPCHCTGDLGRHMFKEEYGKDFLNLGVGRLIEFEQ
jgi:7,8-dihydropterin-6-yl-methyl-4-(beta-D-ribofuranosyl)aminobenzene 5'-phosphate synthase